MISMRSVLPPSANTIKRSLNYYTHSTLEYAVGRKYRPIPSAANRRTPSLLPIVCCLPNHTNELDSPSTSPVVSSPTVPLAIPKKRSTTSMGTNVTTISLVTNSTTDNQSFGSPFGSPLGSPDPKLVFEYATISEYSILSTKEKHALVILLAASGIWSTLSSSIYFPVLPELAKQFHITTSAVNISVVAYLVMQGIIPTFVSSLADHYGRRPCVIGCLIAYSTCCVVIANVDNYWVLASLRCVQSSCIAPLVSISSGVVADMAEPEHRGRFIGLGSGFQLLGQGFGAVLGAAIVSRWGWRGVFNFLAIGGTVVAFFIIILLPETNRSLVGNGSVFPTKFVNKCPILYLPTINKRLVNTTSTLDPFGSLNILGPFKIMIQRDVFFALLPGSFQFAVWTMTLTTLSSTLANTYKFSIMHIGVCYLAPGMGTLVGAVCTGRLLDFIYERRRHQHNKKYGLDSSVPFNIVRARLEFAIFPTILLMAFSVTFGWSIQHKGTVATLLASSFIISCCAISILSASATLLIDMFPGEGSAATSCMNLSRCLIAALFVGVLSDMSAGMGIGWCYTLMACLCGVSGVILGIRVIRDELGVMK